MAIEQGTSSYRRGTIIGLTIAESFMLISFALLLMLALWQSSSRESLLFAKQFSKKEQKDIIQIAKENDFSDFQRKIDQVAKAKRATEFYDKFTEEERSVAIGRARIKDFESILELSKLISEEDMRAIAEAVVTLQKDEKLALHSLISNPELREMIALVEQYAEVLISKPSLVDLTSAIASIDKDVNNPLKNYEKFIGKTTPEEIDKALILQAGVSEAVANALETEKQVAQNIQDKVGPLVNQVGGHIQANGTIILPDTLLFDSNSAKIRKELDAFLRGFCRPWVEILFSNKKGLSTIQIEGHASSEWTGLSPSRAFLENLALSQRRSRAVFARCLELAGHDEVGLWARDAMAAVGYSSSRRIIIDGKEDTKRSRRVVFGIETNISDTFLGLSDDRVLDTQVGINSFENTNLTDATENYHISRLSKTGYSELIGLVTKVRDGDTIVVNSDTLIRLQGIDAPENKELGGIEASEAMRKLVENKNVTCLMDGSKTYDRSVGICFLNGQDIGAILISSGFARDCPKFSGGRYKEIETSKSRTLPKKNYCN